MRNLALFALLITVTTVVCQSYQDGLDQSQKLHTRLRRSMAENRKLKQQMNRMQLIWTGLSQMCKTLQQPDCNCTKISPTEPALVSQKESTPAPEIHNALNDIETLKVLSVKSSGNQSNTLQLTATYIALEDHVTDWTTIFVDFKTGANGDYRTGGEITSHGSGNFSSSVTFKDIHLLGFVTLRIYSGTEVASVGFDLFAIREQGPGEQFLPEFNSPVLSMNYTYTAPKDGIMDIPIVMGISNDILSRIYIDVSVIGFNSSSTPNRLFHVRNDDYPGILHLNVSQKSDNASTVVISLPGSLVQSGGIMFFYSTQEYVESPFGDFVKEIMQGRVVGIMPEYSNDTIPRNTMGLLPRQNVTVVSSVTILSCQAMGNPTPKVTINRVLRNGKRKILKTESLKPTKFMDVALYSLRADDKKTPGLYACRASNGTNVIEELVGVNVFKPAKFDDAKTGVIKNTTNKVVFGCKVTWMQSPELEFRLYEDDGQVIQQDERNKITLVKTNKRTSRITLAVSPPDESMHTIFCVVRVGEAIDYRMIELFPGTDHSYDFN